MGEKFAVFFKMLFVAGLLALAPALASAQTFTIDFSETTGTGYSNNVSGSTSSTGSGIDIQDIEVTSSVANPFDPSHPTLVTNYYNVPFVWNASTFVLQPVLDGSRAIVASSRNSGSSTSNVTVSTCASLTVTVNSATTGSALSGITVLLGTSSATTNSSGVATFTSQVAGSYSLAISATGFTSTTRSVTLSCTETNAVGVSLSPTLVTSSGEIARAVLSWGSAPADLDSHATGPTSSGNTGTSRFHVYYANRTATEARLDRDVVTGFGPETVTFLAPSGTSSLRAGTYRYSVHHFSGTSTIAASRATVSLIINGVERRFTPPATTSTSGSGTVWTVFELVVSSTGAVTVYPINTYTTASTNPYDSNGSAGTLTGYGEVERGIDFSRLPAK